MFHTVPHNKSTRNISTTSQREYESDEIVWNPNANLESHKNSPHKIDLTEVFNAQRLFYKTDVITETELTFAEELSQKYEAEIYLKREDNQRGSHLV